MPRLMALADEREREVQIVIEPARPREPWQFVGPDGRLLHNERFIKTTEGHLYEDLLARCDDDPEGLAQALVAGDPEVDLEATGRVLGAASRVWLRPDGSALYSKRVLDVVEDVHGEARERSDFVDVDATVSDEAPLRWTGRLIPLAAVVRRFVLVRALQLRHVNAPTFDFLYELAERLQREGKVVLVGAGPRGAKPLIFTRNGLPYRGFLEGRVDGTRYRLVLHLSNLALKRTGAAADDEEG